MIRRIFCAVLAGCSVLMLWGMFSIARADASTELRNRVVQLEGKAIAAEGDMRRLQQDVKRILTLLEKAQRDKAERRPVYAADLEPIKVGLADLRYWRTAVTWGAGIMGGLILIFIGLVMRGLVRGEIQISRKATAAPAPVPPPETA